MARPVPSGEGAQPGRHRVVVVGIRGDPGKGWGPKGRELILAPRSRDGIVALGGVLSATFVPPCGGICGLAVTLFLCRGETLSAPPRLAPAGASAPGAARAVSDPAGRGRSMDDWRKGLRRKGTFSSRAFAFHARLPDKISSEDGKDPRSRWERC